MYLAIAVFFVYAFLGWCTEVSFAALTTGRFVNRGFLNGPVCPIYGFGVVLVVACLNPLRENAFLLFLGSVAVTSLLELITGFVLEKLFHQRWWDYSNEPFNLGGYICLRFSIAWGLACLFVMEIVHPTVLWLIRLIPTTAGWVILGILTAALAVDTAATVGTIVKTNRQLRQIEELAGRIRALSNELGENLADRVLDAAELGSTVKDNLDEGRERLQDALEDWKEDLSEHQEDWLDQREARRAQRRAELARLRQALEQQLDRPIRGQQRMLRAFPKLRSLDHRQALEQLRERLTRR